MYDSQPVIDLTVPAVVAMPARSSGAMPITNHSSVRVVISTRTADLNHKSHQYPGAKYLHVSPASISLAPGQTGYVRLVAAMPSTVAGSHYANVELIAASADGTGPVHVEGAVAAAVELTAPGRAVAVALPGHGDGFPALPLASGAGTLALIAALAIAALRRRKKTFRGAHRG